MRSVALAFFFALNHGESAEVMSTATAWGRAKAWLREHEAPDADQQGMQDLKQSDPGAFAIVQALITKSQMGLLDPAHLSASVGSQKSKDEPSAVEILKDASPPAAEASVSEVPVSELSVSATPVHQSLGHNPWTFKTKSVDEDEQMVQNVLGAVSSLRGGAPSKSFLSATPAIDSPVAPVVAAPAKPEASLAEKAKSSYMKDINFAGMFSKGYAPDVAKSPQQSKNLLTAFSWNGEDQRSARTETQYLQAEVIDEKAAKALKKGSLGAWLTTNDEAPVAKKPEEKAPVAIEEEHSVPRDPNAIHDIDSYLNWAKTA